MVKRAKDGSTSKDLWKPGQLNPMAVKNKLRDVRFAAKSIESNMRSSNVDIDYDRLVGYVEELYELLEIDKLAQDNQRRFEEEKARVKEGTTNNV